MAARRAWPSGLVVGVDRGAVLEDALRAHAIDVGADDLGMVSDVDLVVLAAPVLENRRLLSEAGLLARPGTVITDVGSTKQVMMEVADGLPAEVVYVGGHPLAGAAYAGLAHASPDLFRDRPWIFTLPAAPSPRQREALARLEAFASGLGATPSVMDAWHHDRLAAWISHLPQLAASALMKVIGEGAGADALAFAGRGLRDTTRLASSPAHVWVDICRSNPEAIGQALDTLIVELRRLRSHLDDPAVIHEVFDQASAWREQLVARASESQTTR
jgi:prephenate dehydrogenase